MSKIDHVWQVESFQLKIEFFINTFFRKDLSKVDYTGKQLRIYPTQAYLDTYHHNRENMALGESLLNTTFDSSFDDSNKKSKSKKTQFKLTCPTSEYAKHLWKHILSQQVFFTEDSARMVKPKSSKPRIPFFSRGSTVRCPTKRVMHEIEKDMTPPRAIQPENFVRYHIPKGPARVDFHNQQQIGNKFGTMPAMHIKSRPTVVQRNCLCKFCKPLFIVIISVLLLILFSLPAFDLSLHLLTEFIQGICMWDLQTS